MNIFEIATRNKYRFQYRGMITVEDLWDLSQEQLNDIYMSLNKKVKETEVESLLNSNKENVELRTKLEIVKYIFDVKSEEAKQRRDAAKNAEKRQRILEVLAKKQDDSLNNMSKEDLLKMLDELE